jgi:hypothetical protein
LALDYLPGSITFDPVVDEVDALTASKIVWLDCFVTNVDRTPRNANMLMWHKELWLIDHGASLYFHHAWQNWEEQSRRPFAQVKDHVLLRFAEALGTVDQEFRQVLTPGLIDRIVSLIPTDWLADGEESAENKRAVYRDFLNARLSVSEVFVEEARRAREAAI